MEVEPGPEEAAELADSLTLGFLAVLDRLAPVERAVFVLADVFGVPFAEIAETVGKSPAACRQIASRARSRVRDDPSRRRTHPATRPEELALIAELLVAVATGDVDAAVSRLAPDAVCISDGGANKRAARRPVVGAERVARFLVNTGRRGYDHATFAAATINGAPGIVVSVAGEVDFVATFDATDDGRIAAIWMVRNPEKLGHVGTGESVRLT